MLNGACWHNPLVSANQNKIARKLLFQHGSGSSVMAIMRLSATLTLAICLNCFWFVILLLLYPKSAILGLTFHDSKDLYLPNQFSRGSRETRSFSTYWTWCQRRNCIASMMELMLTFNPSYVCHDMNIFWPACFVKFPWRLLNLNRIQPILERLKENITKP